MSESSTDTSVVKNLMILIGSLVLLTFRIIGLVLLMVYQSGPASPSTESSLP